MTPEPLAAHVAAHLEPGDTLYKQVALRIAELIKHGTLRPGERIPSVRGLSEREDVRAY